MRLPVRMMQKRPADGAVGAAVPVGKDVPPFSGPAGSILWAGRRFIRIQQGDIRSIGQKKILLPEEGEGEEHGNS